MGCVHHKHASGKAKKPADLFITPSIFISENFLDINEVYEIGQSLGKGAYGEVRKAKHRKTNLIRAVKIILKDKPSYGLRKELINEVEMIKSVDHPNIIKVFEFFETPRKSYMVMELCQGGELFNEFSKRNSLKEDDCATIIKQLLSAVSYLHSHNIVHLNLKPENILIETKGDISNIKISDFGTATLCAKNSKTWEAYGVAYYLAPELLLGNCSTKSDIWSIGVIAYILLSGRPPFDGEDNHTILNKILKGKYSFTEPIWAYISTEAKDFISSLICPLETRSSAESALDHPWIQRWCPNHRDLQSQENVLAKLKEFNCKSKLNEAVSISIKSQCANSKEAREDKNFGFSADEKILKKGMTANFVKFTEIRKSAEELKINGYEIGNNRRDSRRSNLPLIPLNDLQENQQKNYLMELPHRSMSSAVEISRSLSENPESRPRDLLSLIKTRNPSFDSPISISAVQPEIFLRHTATSDIKISPTMSLNNCQITPDMTPVQTKNLLSKTSSFLNIPGISINRQESFLSEDSAVFNESFDSYQGALSPVDIHAPLEDNSKDFQTAKTMRKYVSTIKNHSRESSNGEKSTLRPTSRNSLMPNKRLEILRTKEVNKVKLENNKFQLNQYMADGLLGQGAFGKVYKATDNSGNIVAIKVYNKKQLRHRWIGKAKTALFAVKSEIEVMEKLEHPNVLQLLEVIDNDESNKIYMVLEFAPGGTINDRSPMPEKEAKRYFKQLILGMEYLHEKALVVHRDIKPQNLLLDTNNNLKISDFGSAQEMANGRDEFSNSAGTWAFMAPELHGGNGLFKGRPVDIWAMGVTLFFMLEGKTPFNGRKLIDLYEAVKNQDVVVPDKFNDDLKDLILKMLNKEPEQRATLEEIKNHPWLKDV